MTFVCAHIKWAPARLQWQCQWEQLHSRRTCCMHGWGTSLSFLTQPPRSSRPSRLATRWCPRSQKHRHVHRRNSKSTEPLSRVIHREMQHKQKRNESTHTPTPESSRLLSTGAPPAEWDTPRRQAGREVLSGCGRRPYRRRRPCRLPCHRPCRRPCRRRCPCRRPCRPPSRPAGRACRAAPSCRPCAP